MAAMARAPRRTRAGELLDELSDSTLLSRPIMRRAVVGARVRGATFSTRTDCVRDGSTSHAASAVVL